MISLHNILSIAKYERKTLLRSWFFRIFSVISILVLFGINFAMVIQGGGEESWAIRSIPSAIPYFNLLILNIAQAVIAVFLASDFLKRDKKLDTTEVIYMRSMTNSEYVVGKTWGNLQVFLVLNILVVGLALIFNMLAQNTSVNWISYGFYLVTISVPTLIFIMGLSFLLMSVIKNQAITFVLVLGYIGITLFLLQAKFYYIFDYMAYSIPMLSSDIIGFGNADVILNHRGIYLFLGTGFIFLTIYLLKRLPQSETMTYLSLIFGAVFIAIGSYFAYRHIVQFKEKEGQRAEAIELNNIYVKEKIPVVLTHNINLEHQGSSIGVTSEIKIKNETDVVLNKLIFNLNTGLKISKIEYNGNEVQFERENHLIIISEGVSLNPGEEKEIVFNYSGKIDEALCYLDIDEETIQEKYGKFVINVDKRYAFLTPDYVLLTPESHWYPKSGVTYSSQDVSWHHSQFVNYSLKVKTKPGLKVISQGKISETEAGQFVFENEHPLTQLSLAIGDYEYKKLETDNLEYGIWVIEGHDFFSGAFNEINDTLPSIINEYLQDFERTYNLEYAFNRLSLVEVPAQMKTYERSWTSLQEFIQPEQILIPEKGYMIGSFDFESTKKRMERFGNRGGASTPKDIQTNILGQLIRNFTEEESANFGMMRGGPGTGATLTQEKNPYYIFPLFYNFQNNIQSDTWPITNRVFEAYVKNQDIDVRSIFMSNMTGLSGEEKANIALQESSFEDILANIEQKEIIDDVIKLKGDFLFSKVQYEAGEEEFSEFLQEVLKEYRFKNISFEDFDQRLNEEFGIELIPIMDDWFTVKDLPGFLISPINAVKVKSGELMRTMVSLKATNFSNTEGLIKLSFMLAGGGGGGRFPGMGRGGGGGGSEDMINELIYLEANQTKDVSILLDAEPSMVMVNTMTSQNIPQVLTENFREIEEDTRVIPFKGHTISENAVLTVQPGEIIVDNEDPGFEMTNNKKVSLLEKWLIKEEESILKYEGINNFRPPTIWTAITNTEFYGNYILSGYYVASGNGNQVAKWNVPIEEAGTYEVYYHMFNNPMARGRGGGRGGFGSGGSQGGEYHFIIHCYDGAVDQLLNPNDTEAGWNPLGTFSFAEGTATIELSNETKLSSVYADAVKFVKL